MLSVLALMRWESYPKRHNSTSLEVLLFDALCSVPQFADIFCWMLQAAGAEGMLEGDVLSDDPLKTKGTLARGDCFYGFVCGWNSDHSTKYTMGWHSVLVSWSESSSCAS